MTFFRHKRLRNLVTTTTGTQTHAIHPKGARLCSPSSPHLYQETRLFELDRLCGECSGWGNRFVLAFTQHGRAAADAIAWQMAPTGRFLTAVPRAETPAGQTNALIPDKNLAQGG